MRLIISTLFFLLAFYNAQSAEVAVKYGNYKDSRIGDINNQTLDQLLFFPERELLYDFDTENPTTGVLSSEPIEVSTDFYMSSPQALKWSTSMGASISFEAGINLPNVWRVQDILTLGLFQSDIPSKENMRVFKIECLSLANTVLHTRFMYLRKGGWNILTSDITGSSSQTIAKITLTQIAGQAGSIYLDNCMIYASQNTRFGAETRGISDEKLAIEKKDDYPTKELTQDEKESFLTIAERVIPLPTKVPALSSSVMDKHREMYHSYHIQASGVYANGVNPLYYYRSFDKLDQESVSTLQYSKNSDLNQYIKSLGKDWYQTEDVSQKEELGKIFCDFIRLTTTYGGMPYPWYNGRGYAEGVYYARELLEQEGLLELASEQIILQYHVDDILYRDHRWVLVLEEGKEGESPTFFWQVSADDLNTANTSTILAVLVGPDDANKARDLYRLKSWMEKLALNYSPYTRGTLKPDGSWFHHNGNRFDNYGWGGAFRGASEYVWWMSHTPFQLNKETYDRMHYMADVRFKVLSKDNLAGPQDAMHKRSSDVYMNLAMAGSSDGSKEIDSIMGSYWLTHPDDNSYIYNPSNVSKVKAAGIKAAVRNDGNITLNWDISNIHRSGDWQVYTRGAAQDFYHTQYERDGFLFYNIGGISICKEGLATGMQAEYGTSIMLRHENDEGNITPGYNFSRALGVTSIVSDFEDLRQIYYQRGSSPFVGGLSTLNGKGVFAQEFDGTKNSAFNDRVVKNLKFKKSYFYFGDDIVALASNIENAGNMEGVETGLLQEPCDGGINTFTFANNITTTGATYNSTYSSSDVPWFVNNTLGTGIYLFPGQEYHLFKGEQSFGREPGNIISTYLKHGSKNDYGFILRLNTDQFEMDELSNLMRSGSPKYSILQKDMNAHILRSEKDNTVAYVIFNPEGWSSDDGTIQHISKSCVLMAQEKQSEAQITLSVSDPDKHIDISEANPLGWSLATEISVTLRGQYEFVNSEHDELTLNVDAFTNSTIVTFTVKDGLANEVVLKENRKQNSLPWIEDFTMADEIDSDNGLSSWSLTSFNPQAVGFAYVLDNDLWMSGINCDWVSGSIDISGSERATIRMELRCDEPKRLSSNDSLCVYMKIDDQPRQLLKTWVDDFEPESFGFDGVVGDSLRLYIEGRSDKNYAAYIVEKIDVRETHHPLSSITFMENPREVLVGENIEPTVSLQPENASDKTVTWTNLTPWNLEDVEEGIYLSLKQGQGKVRIASADGLLSDTLIIQAAYPALEHPWQQVSVGNSFLGRVNFVDEMIELSGNGLNQPSGDNMHCVYQVVRGDFEISGQFSRNTSDAVSGFFAKSDSTSMGKKVEIETSQHGTKFVFRALAQNDAQEFAGDLMSGEIWLKLARSGNRIKGYESVDGENWDLVRSSAVEVGDVVMLGAFINGADYPDQARVTLSNLTFVANNTQLKSHVYQQISVFPNPTNNKITLANSSNEEILFCEIHDVTGKRLCVITTRIKPNESTVIPLRESGLNSGIYFLKALVGNQMVTHKIVLNE